MGIGGQIETLGTSGLRAFFRIFFAAFRVERTSVIFQGSQQTSVHRLRG
jgi:hypothetical protein